MPKKRVREDFVYTFDELSDKAKEKARDWFRQSDHDNFWSEFVLEDAATIAKGLGFGDVEFNWSLSYSQGDFAAVIGSWDASKFSAKKLTDYRSGEKIGPLIKRWKSYVKEFPRASAIVKYHHYYGSQFDFELGEDSSWEDPRYTKAESEMKELLRSFNRYVYDSLRDEHEYQTSDEQTDETIRANDYEFDENGRPA